MRVSVTDLDEFRRFQADEEYELDRLLVRLRRQEPPSEAMLAGSALHKALELAEDGVVASLSQDGYRFEFDTDVEIELSPFREIKAEKVYLVDGYPVTVVGKIDHMHGQRIDDHKSTGRFDAERFLESYQWRYYLDIFNADRFRWNVLEMTEQPEPKVYKIFGFHKLDQFRYGSMREDCLQLLRAYTAFARVHLPERFAVAA